MSNKIYLDYQATTPVDKRILDKMIPYFSENFGNPHSNNHEFGRSANTAVDEARTNIANLINAETSEVIFTSGATESNNLAIKSIAKKAIASATAKMPKNLKFLSLVCLAFKPSITIFSVRV